ncbi:MAG: hypothetical protein JJT76_06055 [Clostridiaceae bacterium]|nr:hypothetical protein [Clostridiaceae bacterium]
MDLSKKDYKALLTAFFDIKASIKILEKICENNNYNGIYIYPFLRDSCVLVHEFEKKYFTQNMNEKIKKIRHRVHLYQKGKNVNKIYFDKIMDYHTSKFSEKGNNLGFYSTPDGKILGSTLYASYITEDAQVLLDSNSIHEFSKDVGTRLRRYLNFISDHITINEELIKGLELNAEQSHFIVNSKDINHKKLFNGSSANNLIKFRLLISLQEIRYAEWLYENLQMLENASFIEIFIFIKCVAIRFDEVRDNLINMNKHMRKDFADFFYTINDDTKIIFDDNWAPVDTLKKIRNTIHYSDTENYFDILQNELKKNGLNRIINETICGYNSLICLAHFIEAYLSIQEIKSESLMKEVFYNLSERMNKTVRRIT